MGVGGMFKHRVALMVCNLLCIVRILEVDGS